MSGVVRPRLDARGSGTRGRGSLYCLGMLMMSTITVCLGDVGRCDYRAGMEKSHVRMDDVIEQTRDTEGTSGSHVFVDDVSRET